MLKASIKKLFSIVFKGEKVMLCHPALYSFN